MARIIFYRVDSMGYSIQLEGDIVAAVVNHGNKQNPESSDAIMVSGNNLSDVRTGMKYVEADGGFYQLDEQGDIINETFVSIT